MPNKYRVLTKPDTVNAGKYAVHYTTVDYSVIIAGLRKSSAEELARIMDSATDIYIHGVYTNDPVL